MASIEQWWDGGEHVSLELGGDERAIFVRKLGSGPSTTLLHGFPSSSHDWAKVAPALAERRSLLMPDFLGFGASEKPRAVRRLTQRRPEATSTSRPSRDGRPRRRSLRSASR